jgi:hypothetical protein
MNISDQEQNIVFQDSSGTDTVCFRNAISDVTFYDSANIITRLVSNHPEGFPFIFIKENIRRETETRLLLDKHLREGRELPYKSFHDDWIIIVIIAVIFLYGLIGTVSKKTFHELTKFFYFRNIGDPVLGDTGGLFHWESTLINLVSFINISLFAWCGAIYYEIIPSGFSGILLLLSLLGVIIAAITIRHIICTLTGNISGEKEAFNEYLLTVYQSYRFLALLMFFLVVLIAYTNIFPVKNLLLAGFILFFSIYLIRITRLFLIFINRNISISYLILYLCALEFLPVVISVKYFTGMF